MKKYYDILKDLREDRDLDQKTVAKAMGIDTSYYGKYEMTVLPNRFVRNIFRNRSFFIICLDFGKLRKEK